MNKLRSSGGFKTLYQFFFNVFSVHKIISHVKSISHIKKMIFSLKMTNAFLIHHAYPSPRLILTLKIRLNGEMHCSMVIL